MRPGKPLTLAEITRKSNGEKCDKTVIAFGLPGNPVSCLVCFQLFVLPATRQLAGWSNPHLQRLPQCLCVGSFDTFFYVCNT